ncbi:hypothetical protein M404DRAFT_741039 [Pisolithus tinctorius Marx 270]|uniref:Uncharacterized protein n=1 Tax=Pisolithus tinctorius Marx 270 TaxID=870435 RepID=A0A0C3JUC9_PISTI|nr:hypothetical protein M404DRAFT_741039 [Pisolithus tinctorius Marx 270]
MNIITTCESMPEACHRAGLSVTCTTMSLAPQTNWIARPDSTHLQNVQRKHGLACSIRMGTNTVMDLQDSNLRPSGLCSAKKNYHQHSTTNQQRITLQDAAEKETTLMRPLHAQNQIIIPLPIQLPHRILRAHPNLKAHESKTFTNTRLSIPPDIHTDDTTESSKELARFLGFLRRCWSRVAWGTHRVRCLAHQHPNPGLGSPGPRVRIEGGTYLPVVGAGAGSAAAFANVPSSGGSFNCLSTPD